MGHRRRLVLAGLLLGLAVTEVSGCVAGGLVPDTASARSLRRHAETAWAVMTRDPYERSANDAARLVVGRGDDDTIDALVVEGTTWHGRIVLRIVVDDDNTNIGTTKCYSYTFTRKGSDDGKPDTVTCPTSPPVVLTAPVPEPNLGTPGQARRLRSVLAGLSAAERHDAEVVQRRMSAAFGSPAKVSVDKGGDGSLFVAVELPDFASCLTASVDPSGHITTHSGGTPKACQP
jgi:hypothetical protein